ncbi:uncharacterized protein B0H18DRAFT_1009690 [Fomitopsis serialis]|uniref:uncharacterized protein n=1 Tax=Fomitopsis serialis TaxID=139415 RepID=UPI002008BD15|nr:uncharacterized protein B0H18DRAFT_1009690 [Neoantrodia serialis]KAH9925326.1 hypothetical protein B0H18DRAFT_1009690 [Neoantrodia serialis]
MTDPADAAANSLGLDLDALKIKDDPESSGSPAVPKDEEARTEASEKTELPKPDEGAGEEAEEEEAKSPTSEDKSTEPREKKKPYVNPERVKTGGAQRDKLSEEELTVRMARIREQNEKIKQRRMDVQADEDAFKKTQEAERIKAAKTKKVQETIDRTREQNARRKLEKVNCHQYTDYRGSQGNRFRTVNGMLGNRPVTGSRPTSLRTAMKRPRLLDLPSASVVRCVVEVQDVGAEEHHLLPQLRRLRRLRRLLKNRRHRRLL